MVATHGGDGKTSLFVITASGTTVRTNPHNGVGQGTFIVSNVTDRTLRGRVRVVPLEGAPETWAGVSDPEREFPPRGTQQFAMTVTVPAGTTGSFKYQPYVAWVESTDDYSYPGPAFTVEAASPPPPAPPRRPWWMLAIPVILIIALAIGGGVWWQGEKAAAAASASATATAQAMDATASATATAQAGVLARVGRYVGTWSNSEVGKPGITTMSISNSGATLTVKVLGKVRDVVGSGGPAQQVCPGNNECATAEHSLPFAGDPVTVAVEFTPTIGHQLTITLTPDGATASALDQVTYRGASSYTTTYTFTRVRRLIPGLTLPFQSRVAER